MYEFRLYSSTLVTTPAPTVLPPSRRAKRRPSAIATGQISSMSKLALSPGTTYSYHIELNMINVLNQEILKQRRNVICTISTPSGSLHEPVTSAVRKKN